MKPCIVALVALFSLVALPCAVAADGAYDGDWITRLACEAHGQTEAYKWEFPSVIKDGNFHGQHSEPGAPGYLVIDGKINSDGSAKLAAKGTVTKNNAHGIFAMRGDNYSYNIKAQFHDTKGTGTRDEGAGILGRSCTFEFVKQTGTVPPTSSPAANPDH